MDRILSYKESEELHDNVSDFCNLDPRIKSAEVNDLSATILVSEPLDIADSSLFFDEGYKLSKYEEISPVAHYYLFIK